MKNQAVTVFSPATINWTSGHGAWAFLFLVAVYFHHSGSLWRLSKSFRKKRKMGIYEEPKSKKCLIGWAFDLYKFHRCSTRIYRKEKWKKNKRTTFQWNWYILSKCKNKMTYGVLWNPYRQTVIEKWICSNQILILRKNYLP